MKLVHLFAINQIYVINLRTVSLSLIDFTDAAK